MFKAILILEVKACDVDKNSQFKSFWYKEIHLPFIPICELKICFSDSRINPTIDAVTWKADENHFICDCIEKCVEEIGENKYYKDYPKFIQSEYVRKGWDHLEYDDYDQIITSKDLNFELSHFGFPTPSDNL